jgi:hypothetical protein
MTPKAAFRISPSQRREDVAQEDVKLDQPAERPLESENRPDRLLGSCVKIQLNGERHVA